MKELVIYEPYMNPKENKALKYEEQILDLFVVLTTLYADQNISLTRFNIKDHPKMFYRNDAVAKVLEEKTESCLPLVYFEGELVCENLLPTPENLKEILGL